MTIPEMGEFFINLVLKGWVIDTRAGGYVLGRSHEQGNIYMFRFVYNSSESKISFDGNLEGGEYIVNYGAYIANKERFDEINKFYDQTYNIEFDKIKMSSKTRIFNAHATPYDKLLLIDNQNIMLINKFATAKYFEEIEHLNDVGNTFQFCDISSFIPKEKFG